MRLSYLPRENAPGRTMSDETYKSLTEGWTILKGCTHRAPNLHSGYKQKKPHFCGAFCCGAPTWARTRDQKIMSL